MPDDTDQRTRDRRIRHDKLDRGQRYGHRDGHERSGPRPIVLPRHSDIQHRDGRSAVAVFEPDGKGGSRASAAVALHDADGRRDMLAARGPAPSRNGPLLPVGAECVTAGRSAGASGLGVPVQDQFDLAQGEKGWRVGRTWSRLLLPQRDGDASVWDTGEKRPHVGSGASPGQSVLLAQAGRR